MTSPSRRRGTEGDFWPGAEEELLIRAALGEGDTALAAWQALRPTLDLESMEGEPIRLLPMLYRNLTDLGVEDELLPRLKGTYRQTWYLNQLLTGELADFVATLAERGIATMVLKGAAIVPCYYEDYGVRPMADVDVLVRARETAEAAQVLIDAGWVPREDLATRMRRGNHALPFANSDRHEVDLHWSLGGLFDLSRPDQSIEAFWEDAVPLQIGGTSTRTLNAADTVLHLLLHGVRGHWGSRLRWPTDALTVIRAAGPDLDWDRLIRLAQVWHGVLPVRDALTYLRAAFDAPVPEPVVAELRRIPISRRERLGYRLTARRVDPKARFPLATWVAGDFLRWSSDGGTLRSLVVLPRYVTSQFGLASKWEIPQHAWRLLRRPRRVPAGSAAGTPPGEP